MLNNSPKVTLFALLRAGVKHRQAGSRTILQGCLYATMSHLEQPGEMGQWGHWLDTLSWASPGGGPPFPELLCKVTPAGGRAVANLQRECRGTSLAPHFW